MAKNVKRSAYDPYRNLGYAYDGSAVRVLEGQEVLEPRPQVRPRPRRQEREAVRPKVEARPAGKVSLFAVAGFAVVAALAVMILMNCVTLATVSGDVVDLSNQMAQLKSEEATLLARYELAYDLGAIENDVTSDGSMSRPQPGQMIYVDLTEPDSVVIYEIPGEEGTGILAAIQSALGLS